jgi:hypothetical protein
MTLFLQALALERAQTLFDPGNPVWLVQSAVQGGA